MKRAINLYKNAYGGLSSATWLLSIVMLVNRCGTMVLPFMTLYLTENKQVSLGKAGIVMALFGAGAVAGGLIGGKLTDKIGFYYIQLIALGAGGLLFFVLGAMQSYTMICIVTFVLSLVNESFRPANAAAIAAYSQDHNRTRSYSLNRLAVNLGWALGGGLGGLIAAYDYHLLFWIDGFTNIGAAILLWVFLAPSKAKAAVPSEVKQVSATPVLSAYRDKYYMAFILLSILFAYGFFQVFSTLPVYLKKELFLDEKFIGSIMALNGLIITFVEMVMVFKLDGRRPNLHYIFYGVLLTGFAYCILYFSLPAAPLAILFIILITFGEMLSMPFMNAYWTSRSVAANRGQYAGLYTVSWSIAQVLGPASGALIAERFGFTALWFFVAGVCVLAAFGFKWLQIRERLSLLKT